MESRRGEADGSMGPPPLPVVAGPVPKAHSDTASPTVAPWKGAGGGRPPAVTMAGLHPSSLHGGQPAMPELAPPEPKFPDTIDPLPAAFRPAEKRIVSQDDLKRFLQGEAARAFLAFVLCLADAVKGKKLSEPCPSASPAVDALEGMLRSLSGWVDEVPPVQQSLRYGNPAYRTWFSKLSTAADGLAASLLPEGKKHAAAELVPYLLDSFGNYTRIDYGTGHETNFAALLFCLGRLGAVAPSDAQALVCRVFAAYLDLMRKIQVTYWLEPAGSHGVWGLDDYQFLPFLWGAAQLVGHPVIKPKSIHSDDVLEAYAHEYLYLSCVKFVKQVKKGPLFETSPIVCDIAGVPAWAKVCSGLVKMYAAEVLSKFPIMQHFLFGQLLPFK